MQFSELNLEEGLLKAISDLGFTEPSEIQEKAIPILLEGDKDFVGQAQTGTGKTAAFVLPTLQRIDLDNDNIQTLILAPTRELANQVNEEIFKLTKYHRVESVVIYGGVCYDKQIREIRRKRPQIIVGTPGRILDLMDRRVLDFSNTNQLILDEADEMLKMGFIDDVKEILSKFQENRRMWMFSATMPDAIVRLIKEECNDPEIVKLKKKTLSNADIEQQYYLVENRYRKEALFRLLTVNPDYYAMIFCRTKADTKDVYNDLIDRGVLVEVLNGDMGQDQRDVAMSRFKSKKVRLMVCTDVAARGIDVNDLTHVFNYGLPQDIESYVHRIGRTGRAGKKGIAALLIDRRDTGMLRRIEQVTKTTIAQVDLPKVEDLKAGLIKNFTERLAPIIEAVGEKGEEFYIDSTFSNFEEFFESQSKEEIQKILFTYLFNKDLRRITDLGELRATKERSGGRGGRGGRDSRGGGRDGDRRRGGRDSRGGGRDSRGGGRDGRRGGRDSRGGERDGGERRERRNYGDRDDRRGERRERSYEGRGERREGGNDRGERRERSYGGSRDGGERRERSYGAGRDGGRDRGERRERSYGGSREANGERRERSSSRGDVDGNTRSQRDGGGRRERRSLN